MIWNPHIWGERVPILTAPPVSQPDFEQSKVCQRQFLWFNESECLYLHRTIMTQNWWSKALGNVFANERGMRQPFKWHPPSDFTLDMKKEAAFPLRNKWSVLMPVSGHCHFECARIFQGAHQRALSRQSSAIWYIGVFISSEAAWPCARIQQTGSS